MRLKELKTCVLAFISNWAKASKWRYHPSVSGHRITKCLVWLGHVSGLGQCKSSGVTSSPCSSLPLGTLWWAQLLSLVSALLAPVPTYGPLRGQREGYSVLCLLGLIPSTPILVRHSSLSPNVTSAVTPWAQKCFLFGSIMLCVGDFPGWKQQWYTRLWGSC